LPHLSRMPAEMAARVAPMVFQRFASGRDMTLFGLVNAVTSVARDTRDPDVRWRLEELGGSMPARVLGSPKLVAAAAAAR
jgi:hypothetical protein